MARYQIEDNPKKKLLSDRIYEKDARFWVMPKIQKGLAYQFGNDFIIGTESAQFINQQGGDVARYSLQPVLISEFNFDEEQILLLDISNNIFLYAIVKCLIFQINAGQVDYLSIREDY